MNAPNLSQYFTNDPPSPFDGIGGKSSTFEITYNICLFITSASLSKPLLPNVGPDSYIENESAAHSDSEELISDSVKDCWEPAEVEIGIPPILTMPGVQLATELVNVMINLKWYVLRLMLCGIF